jgi:glycosyltransferase involved in cell wall biosynthesis
VRVALIVTGGVDAAGRDVTPALLWLIERLARHHDLHVFALHYYPQPRTYSLAGATVHDIGRVGGPPGFRRVRMLARLRGALRACGPFDVLHAYLGIPAALTTAVARTLDAPVVATLDSGELVSLPDIRYGLQRRWIDRRAIARAIREAARVTVSTGYMAMMPALRGTPVDVVPIGIDANRFTATAVGGGPPWRLLRVGSINRVKDYPTLLRAFAAVVGRMPQVHLDIVGDDTLNGTMQQLSRALGISAQVTFHGFQAIDTLVAFYARAHLHVISSRHEAASVAALEAACAGVPTVGTDVGYVADWAASGRAVAVPPGDDQALASAIVHLLRDPERRARISTSARCAATSPSSSTASAPGR